ncbi:hypothetical protein [uncultured Rikenella sp.]|uniref:hypothetical protein n=1 Tax=uncultured Rikenella sp. TaxID=368003 RepID=UPI0026087174|nr:hypothetical protein [uncultured Rikenella sp.]
MANFKEDAAREYDWESGGVYVIEPEDPVEGGAEGVSNRQGRELALRTRNLHERLDELKRDTTARADELAEAIDTKDAEALKMAKEYADRLVAELTDSAPEALDTLKELAAALGDDPNFSATVMELIGERVTAEAMAEALEGKFGIIGNDVDANEMTQGSGYSYSKNTPTHGTVATFNGLGVLYGIMQIFCDNQETNNARFWVRNNNQQGFTPWRELWHSGNFDPSVVFRTGGYIDAAKLNDNEIAQIGNKACIINYGGYGGLLVSFSAQASPAPLQFFLDNYSENASLKWRHGVDANRFQNPAFRTIWDSGNLKPMYYAQINPNGNVVGQVGDWIQSVAWVDNGNGVRCDITPNVPVNAVTAQITKVAFSGNTFTGSAPIVYDTLINGKITVVIPHANGSGYAAWFNISIQGA